MKQIEFYTKILNLLLILSMKVTTKILAYYASYAKYRKTSAAYGEIINKLDEIIKTNNLWK